MNFLEGISPRFSDRGPFDDDDEMKEETRLEYVTGQRSMRGFFLVMLQYVKEMAAMAIPRARRVSREGAILNFVLFFFEVQ